MMLHSPAASIEPRSRAAPSCLQALLDTQLVPLVVAKVHTLLEQLGQLPVSNRAPSVELPTATMVGMDALRDQVLERTKLSNVVLLHGMGGIGKTTCAKAVYQHLRTTAFKLQHCHYVQLQHDMRPRDLQAVQEKVLASVVGMAVPVQSTEDGVGRIRTVFAKLKMLLVVDNVWGSQLRDLLPQDFMTGVLAPGSILLVTSREETAVESFITADACTHLLPMPLMGTTQAKELFCKHAFHRDSAPAEKEALVASIVSRCGNLPQALEVAGKLLARYKDDKAWRNIDRALLMAFNTMQAERHDGYSTLYAAYAVSIDHLNEPQKELLLDIAFFLVGQSWGAVLAYTDYDCFSLEHLKQCALVKEERSTRWLDNAVGMHDTMVEFCCKHVKGSPAWRDNKADGDVLPQVIPLTLAFFLVLPHCP
jgi:hypothetical protein